MVVHPHLRIRDMLPIHGCHEVLYHVGTATMLEDEGAHAAAAGGLDCTHIALQLQLLVGLWSRTRASESKTCIISMPSNVQ
jgi:hypothetical protein